jgi:hypothetical protein
MKRSHPTSDPVHHPTADPPTPTAVEMEEWLFTPASAGRSSSSRRSPPSGLSRLDWIAAALLIVATFAARWPLVERGATLLHSDEAIVGIMAQDIAEGRRLPIYFYGQRYMGAAEAYLIAALGPWFDDPIVALRVGPLCFFAAFVAVQYLMLARWFGRSGAAAAVALLLAAPPMFAQWSISARGGYVEILLIGSCALWAYLEWFASRSTEAENPVTPRRHRRRLFAFGALIGVGWWVNPSIVLFAAPIAFHWLLKKLGERPSRAADCASPQSNDSSPCLLPRVALALGHTTLPVVALIVVLLLNCCWAVWVEEERLYSRLLLGIVSPPVAGVILCAAALTGIIASWQRTDVVARLRGGLPSAGPLLAGLLVGAMPAVMYVVLAVIGAGAMDPSLPLGIRPLWTIGSTLTYLACGLPLLFGADARPFLDLVTIGRPPPFEPPDIVVAAMASGANWLVVGAAATACAVFVLARRESIGGLLRLAAGCYEPATLFAAGAAITVALYVLSGAAHDFNTIRYLIPLWVFVPAIAAVIFADRTLGGAGRVAVVSLGLGWAVGQFAMVQQLGRPHVLEPLAATLAAGDDDVAVAEIFDAHLLSFLTGQRCRVAEFEPFWSRLGQYQDAVAADGPVTYVVPPPGADQCRTEWRHPGPPPPETTHSLRMRIDGALRRDPDLLIECDPLPGGYERFRLSRPIMSDSRDR